MGGLGPGIGGMEYIVIAIVALLVVGPERLPAMLHKLGKLVAKARNMANEFRHSFDEMARQSELDELRKEVEALRHGQTNMMPLGADAEAAFKSISQDLNAPLTAPDPAPTPVLTGPEEWPDSPPVMTPLEPEALPAPKPRAPRKPAASKAAAKTSGKATGGKAAAPKPAAAKKTPPSRRKAVEL